MYLYAYYHIMKVATVSTLNTQVMFESIHSVYIQQCFVDSTISITCFHSYIIFPLGSVNDVQAVGPDAIYFTNDGYNRQFFKRFVEHLIKVPWSNVVFYDGNVGHGTIVVKRGLGLNGINISPDSK